MDKTRDLIKKIALLMEDELSGTIDADALVDALSSAVNLKDKDTEVKLEQPNGEVRDLTQDDENNDDTSTPGVEHDTSSPEGEYPDNAPKFKSQLDVNTAIDAIRILKQELKKIGCSLLDWYIDFHVRGFDITSIRISCDNAPSLRKDAPANPKNPNKNIGDTILALRKVYGPYKTAVKDELKLDCMGFEYDKVDTGALSISASDEELGGDIPTSMDIGSEPLGGAEPLFGGDNGLAAPEEQPAPEAAPEAPGEENLFPEPEEGVPEAPEAAEGEEENPSPDELEDFQL